MDYQGWNAALCAWFFRPDLKGVPVYLAVDDDVLAEIGQANGLSTASASEDFESAVANRLRGNRPFEDQLRQASGWKVRDGKSDPPFVATLAATVLAASRMAPGDQGGAGQYSYYRPLRKIIGAAGEGMPVGYDDAVPVLWGYLKRWLNETNDGELGLATAATRPAVTNIGWALSQAVVGGVDRARLHLFFRAIGAQPGEDLEPSELLKRFQEWCRLSGRAGDRLRARAFDTAANSILAAVLHAELLRFDGTDRDSSGRRCLSTVLTASDLGGAPFGFAVEVPDELRGGHLQLSDGRRIEFPEGRSWVEFDGFDVVAGPSTTLDLSAERFRVLSPRRRCWIFQIHDSLGKWSSVDAAEIGIEHRVLVRVELQDAAETAMRAAGGDPVVARRATLPSGWLAYARYVPTRGAQAEPEVAGLAPRAQQLASLVGGLRVSTEHSVYLMGFPPDLVVPTAFGEHFSVKVDGQVQDLPAGAQQGTLVLSGLGLGPGEHELMVGSRRIRIHLVERVRETTPQASIGLPVRAEENRRWFGGVPTSLDADAVRWLSGAALSDDVERRVTGRTLLRQSGRLYVLGEREGARVYPSQPTWLSDHGLFPPDFDLEPALTGLPFSALWSVAWLADCRRVRRVLSTVVADGPLPTRPPVLFGEDDWREVLTPDGPPFRCEGSREDQAAWSAYKNGAD